MQIRPAVTRDARSIARIQVRGWQIGYRGIVPDAYLARMTVEERMNRWLANLAELDALQTVVAEDDDEVVVGWAGFGPNRSDLGPEVGELAALYVEPGQWSHGIGGALLGGRGGGRWRPPASRGRYCGHWRKMSALGASTSTSGGGSTAQRTRTNPAPR